MKFSFPVKTANNINSIRTKVFVYALSLVKTDSSLSWSECLKTAWATIKADPSKYIYIEFTKVNGTIAKRVILNKSWITNNEIKGTGRPTKEGTTLYTDAVKFNFKVKYSTGSFQDKLMIDCF